MAPTIAGPTVLQVIIGLFLGTYFLFALYLSYCTLRIARDNGKLAMCPPPVKSVCWSILGLAILLDIAFNILVGSILFREFPHYKRLTFTARCNNHYNADTWRGARARKFCDGWLNPFEAGHCK